MNNEAFRCMLGLSLNCNFTLFSVFFLWLVCIWYTCEWACIKIICENKRSYNERYWCKEPLKSHFWSSAAYSNFPCPHRWSWTSWRLTSAPQNKQTNQQTKQQQNWTKTEEEEKEKEKTNKKQFILLYFVNCATVSPRQSSSQLALVT